MSWFNYLFPSVKGTGKVSALLKQQAHAAKKEVSATASDAMLHGPGSLLGVPGLGRRHAAQTEKKAEGAMGWLDKLFPVLATTKKEAGETFGELQDAADVAEMKAWDESKHPRISSGSDKGGEFASAGGAGTEKKLTGYTRLPHDLPQGLSELSDDARAGLTVTKDANGRLRWLLISSSAYMDRDGEIVTLAAHEADVARMNATKEFGPLRWWHVGTPTAQDPNPAQLLDLGDCDFAAMHDRMRIESGTFRDEAVGAKMAARAKELAASLGFYHGRGEPEADGTFRHIYTIERSLLPKDRASNFMTAVLVKPEGLMDDIKKKELAALLGEGGEQVVDGLLTEAGIRQKAADRVGVTTKAKAKDLQAEADDEETEAGDGAETAGDEAAESPAHEAAETPDEETAEHASAKKPVAKKETIGEWTPEQLVAVVADTVTKAFAEISEAAQAARVKEAAAQTALLAELTATQTAALKQANLNRAAVEKMQAELTALKGDAPRGIRSWLPSQGDANVVDNDITAQIKQQAGPKTGLDKAVDFVFGAGLQPR